ncbi:8367_t:CDS:2 [Entrophospora sp. SA101]|nr:22638_t:CDS:2 [Entrophospora sp. SA101]CAJ0753866.1 8367_t:CDS:2 [Entrophospora sp. SA101]CAJ0917291.1 12334_t:CDS:2 [Entrophospora sp. SA101]
MYHLSAEKHLVTTTMSISTQTSNYSKSNGLNLKIHQLKKTNSLG